jgi:diguanylate cyclase (GGDEF)-like protein
MLHLTSTLARNGNGSQVVHDLDRRLHAGLGARLRSVIVRDAVGSFRIVELRTEKERALTSSQLRRALGDAISLAEHMEAGTALTVETDAWSVLTATLSLPEWVAAVTLVPIVAEGRWVGILPVLWPTRTTPDRDQLRLLHGLAGQMGLAMARGELEQMRRSATVDPLTGLLNRRAIATELSAFVARSERAGGRLSVLLLEFSPGDGEADAGDAVLQIAASTIRTMLRNGDSAGRQDDDRLLVIAADAESARSLGRRIEAAIRSNAATAGVRTAIGIASYPDDGPTAGDLLEAADLALDATSPRTPASAYLAGVAEGTPSRSS